MKHAFALLAVVAAAVVAALPAAAGIAEGVKLTPRNASGVSGTAIASSPGDAAPAAVRVNVRGLKPNALVRIQVNAVDGKHTSASTVLILSARADAKGTLAGSGRVRYRGTPVTFATIADGAHAISVLADGKLVARGTIPGMS